MVTFAKEKVEVADDEKVVSYSVVDGELVSFYKNFRVTVQVTDKGADGAGTVVNWTMEFDKASNEIISDEE
ncbi:MLP-like protein 34 [Triticum urartu]|uniref:MLP-like protein 34 n=1 Tax=Triticum urartu TaxID=4572 RepID=M7ZUL3_TRIUA|nr:MLP-like protein 34 [Triticum urartu]